MDYASQLDPVETELSIMMPQKNFKSQNVSLPTHFDDQKHLQLITDFDDADDEIQLKQTQTQTTRGKNEDLEQLQTSRRLLSNQKDQPNDGIQANTSTFLDITDISFDKIEKKRSLRREQVVIGPEQSTGWLFGIYLRYIIWPQFSLLLALYVLIALDITSLAYQSFLCVPLILEGGKQIQSASLSLCLIQLVLQVISVKLTLQMLIFRHFKVIPTLLHVLRLASSAVICLQIIFHRKTLNTNVPLSYIYTYYPVAWSLQVFYQPFSIWVGISVRYWITVLGTRQRILLLLHNRVPIVDQRGMSDVKIKVVPKMQLERSVRMDQEEQERLVIANRIHQIRVMKRQKINQPRSNYRRRIADQVSQFEQQDR